MQVSRVISTHWLRHFIDNVLALLLLLLLSFLMLDLLPGNQIDALFTNDLGLDISQQSYELALSEYGLDKPVATRFVLWLAQVASGNLGYSALHVAPVADILLSALPWTLALLACALPLSFFVGAIIGLASGMQVKSNTSKVLFSAMVFMSNIPIFVLGLLLLRLFSYSLGWLPSGGAYSLGSYFAGVPSILELVIHAILPVSMLFLHAVIHYYYLSYALAQQINKRRFIFYARIRGIRGWRLLVSWFLPNALPELLSRLSSSLPHFIGLTIYVEAIFSYPGLGQLLLDAIYNRDYVLLQGCILVIGILVLAGNTLLDLISEVLNARG